METKFTWAGREEVKSLYNAHMEVLAERARKDYFLMVDRLTIQGMARGMDVIIRSTMPTCQRQFGKNYYQIRYFYQSEFIDPMNDSFSYNGLTTRLYSAAWRDGTEGKHYYIGSED